MADFVAETGIKSGIIPTMITTFGVRLTQYAALAQVQITMDDLFTWFRANNNVLSEGLVMAFVGEG